jgi:hypothetical protein
MGKETDEQNKKKQNKSKKKITKVKVSQYVSDINKPYSLEKLNILEEIVSEQPPKEKIDQLLKDREQLEKKILN